MISNPSAILFLTHLPFTQYTINQIVPFGPFAASQNRFTTYVVMTICLTQQHNIYVANNSNDNTHMKPYNSNAVHVTAKMVHVIQGWWNNKYKQGYLAEYVRPKLLQHVRLWMRIMQPWHSAWLSQHYFPLNYGFWLNAQNITGSVNKEYGEYDLCYANWSRRIDDFFFF